MTGRYGTGKRMMRGGRAAFLVLGVALAAVAVVASRAVAADEGALEARVFDLDWTIALDGIPADAKNAVVWIAVPQQLAEQDRLELAVDTEHEWKLVRETPFGNELVQVTVANPAGPLAIDLKARVHRRPVTAPIPAPLDSRTRALYLREESLVTLSDRVRALADSVGGGHRDRYDFVLGLMDYDKSVPGYGFGDTERACDVRKGNCTDFHSLFLSLSRAKSVPALFEMGYPTKLAGETDVTGGYHCWAWFFEDGARLPVDISEADKNPAKTDFFYGNLDADRITFSRGREVTLPGMRGAPLNYVPSGAYAEVDGAPFEGVTRSLSYRVESVPTETALR